jgi:hypothetical protein
MHNKFPEASSVGFDWEGILQSVFLWNEWADSRARTVSRACMH